MKTIQLILILASLSFLSGCVTGGFTYTDPKGNTMTIANNENSGVVIRGKLDQRKVTGFSK